ncbi:MAG: hypothetical protein JXR07_02630 [Reichenbachiella sp.]
MKLKWLFLFVLIGMPVCIYLFLQSFGENHFVIPIFYEKGLESPLVGCQKVDSNKQFYARKYFEIDADKPDFESNRVVVYDLGGIQSNGSEVRNNMLTFLNKFQGYEEIQFVSLSTSNASIGTLSTFENAKFYQSNAKDILSFSRCDMQIDLRFDAIQSKFTGSKLVLCDDERRIRGVYDPLELKEIDRLNTELHILLSN